MIRCLIAPRAQRDLKDIWLNIAEDSVSYADKLIDRLLAETELIAENPKMGVERPDLASAVRGFTVDRRYLILYQIIDNGIEVLHIVHGARDLSTLGFNEPPPHKP